MTHLTTNEARHICLTQNIPFFCYRLPGDSNIYFGAMPASEDVYHEGFIMYPFDNTQELPPLYIAASIYFCNELTDEQAINRLLTTHHTAENRVCQEKDITYAAYKEHVNDLIALLRDNAHGLQKIVYARTQTIRSLSTDTIIDTFSRLIETYPQAFVYQFYYPGKSHWMGASPEIFFKQDESGFETMALAGTKKEDEEWGQKERDEQQFVSQYISTILEEITPENFSQSSAETFLAGNIQHLCTTFRGYSPLNDDKIAKIFSRMHPTPAVGGVPKEVAVDLIRKTEPVSRKYYSGYLGRITRTGCYNLFVNLRCMELFSNATRLYAGGGIIAESSAEKEWQETREKMNTLLNCIENI